MQPDPSEIQLTFREDITQPEQQKAAKRSVSALISRSMERFARAGAAEAELAKVTDALDSPLRRLIGGDKEATGALDSLHSRYLIDTDATDGLYQNQLLPADAPATDFRTIIINRPPYHFSWSWHDQNGHAPHNQILINNTGEVGLDARSGSVDGGVSGLVAAHAGFGLVLRTDRTVTASGWSILDPGRFSYNMATVGIGSNATSEGGVEVTALENGRLIGSAGFRWWRRRISAGESASDREGPYTVGLPGDEAKELIFTMQPGREYTFNAGIWVFSDRSPGIEAAAVQSLAQGTVTKIWINR